METSTLSYQFIPHTKRIDPSKFSAPNQDNNIYGRLDQEQFMKSMMCREQHFQDKNLATVLIRAVCNNRANIADKFPKCMVGLDDQDKNGRTALHHCILKNDLNFAKSLVEGGCDMNIPDQFKFTPLIQAVLKERTELVRFLVQAGANMNFKDCDGETALEIAQESKNKEIIEILSAKSN